jgi:glycosyltransferase involved in cell wall biosynthesis
MKRHYIFFTRNSLPQARADLVQVANCANAAANLGYSTVLTYISKNASAINPKTWLLPFQPKCPDEELARFYNLQEQLQVSALPIPSLIGRFKKNWSNPSTFVCKYLLPIHLRPVTQIVHTRDWNFAKAAVKCGIPAIYEHHHHEDKQFESEIVHHPLFQVAVTVADSIREDMIQRGMPANKVIKLHNGFNQAFIKRQPEAVQQWRQKLLTEDYRYLVVYSGGLNKFKGVDLLIDTAQALPNCHIVFAGGDATKVQVYQELSQAKQVYNTTFLGYLPHHQLASLLQAADVLVHPHCLSKEATFTSPLKFFDYMAAGSPIVATEIPPLMEFKSSGVVAGWCEPDNAIALTQCIKHILETHPRKLEGYTVGMDYVQQFSWENRINTILSHVEESLRPQVV